MRERLRERLRDVDMATHAGAVAVGGQLKPEGAAMRVVARDAVSRRRWRMNARVAHPAANLLMTCEAQTARLASACLVRQFHDLRPSGLDRYVAREALSRGRRPMHDPVRRHLTVAGDAATLVAGSHRWVSAVGLTRPGRALSGHDLDQAGD